jgi:AcrR family transcriptional regulator
MLTGNRPVVLLFVVVAQPALSDGRLIRGQRTRQAILSHASKLASAEGLEAVSLQRLATDLGISKSGLFAHFGSKEELQLATVEEAGRVFTDEVLRPGLKPPAGVGRVWAMCNAYLSYLQRAIFPGGCFFEAALAEFDSRPGPVRDAIVEKRGYWVQSLTRAVREAAVAGEVRRGVDPEQVGWELECLLVGANCSFVMDKGSPTGLERARKAIRARLESIATPKAKRLPTR